MVTNFYFGFFLSFFSIYIIIMRCWPKIILIILILVTLFLLYQHFGRNKSLVPITSNEKENSLDIIENFSIVDTCSLTPKLLDVNYDNYVSYTRKKFK